MSTLLIIGALWGDEAKGKLVDVLAEEANWNVRFSGGNNAGHTVQVGDETFKFHLVPSGILHPDCTAVLAGGMVICPRSLLDELNEVKSRRSVHGKLLVSGSAHVVFPYHRTLDALEEGHRGDARIGTTGRGIGPAYQDKVARIGIRMAELVDPNRFENRLRQVLELKNRHLEAFGGELISFDSLFGEYSEYAAQLKEFVGEAELQINQAVRNGERLLFEGAQGALLDLDTGTYPFVTSSHPTAAGACLGSGLPPNKVKNVLGVGVAYSTRVGTGPFPTEQDNEIGERIRIAGKEFGTTTGRPRRTGWIDLVALRHSARMNGFTSLAITRLDVLSGFDQIGMGVAYNVKGNRIQHFPGDTEILECAQPVFDYNPGWSEDITNSNSLDSLPQNAKDYLRKIEQFTETPISIVSIGPGRNQTLILRPDLLW